MTRWNFPSALEWEMMSAASVPLAEVIKKRGSEFPQVFFFFYFSSLLWHSRRVWQIEIRGETKNFEHVTVSSPVFHTCKCSNPCCNFPNFEASMQWHHARFSHKGGKKRFFLVWLAFICQKNYVTLARSCTTKQVFFFPLWFDSYLEKETTLFHKLECKRWKRSLYL